MRTGMRPSNTIKDQKGMVLLITLAIIAVLITLSFEVNRKVRTAVYASATSRDRLTLAHMASSGINIAKAILLEDKKKTSVDSLYETWADAEKISEIIEQFPFEKGSLSLDISDESAKIQANALVDFPKGRIFNNPQKIVWLRLLDQENFSEAFEEDSGSIEIVNAVKDWLDRGDDDAITGLSGAESDYYLDLEVPVICRNGPLQYLEELLMVKQMTPALFYGSDGSAGLLELMTIHGSAKLSSNNYAYSGSVNINTASLPVIKALLSEEHQDLAQAIYDYREDPELSKDAIELSKPTWYKNAPGCSSVLMDPKLISIASNIFRIRATASLHDTRLTITSVVQRQQDAASGSYYCKVLSREVL
jgi:general secretion pathway protein K